MKKTIIYLRAASIEPKQKYDSIESQKAKLKLLTKEFCCPVCGKRFKAVTNQK